MRRSYLRPILLALAVTAASAGNALAVPLLQLDIAGGSYDYETKTIVAGSNPFTLSVIGTPYGVDGGYANVSASRLLSTTWYLSMAVTPQVMQPGADLGSFTFNGETIQVTSGMVYGKPPIEVFEELQGADRGDLQGHEIYPTYFTEFSFQFDPTMRLPTYDTAVRVATGGAMPAPSVTGGSYYREFVVDTTNLNSNFMIHFDSYDEALRQCGLAELALTGSTPAECVDMDTSHWGSFTHDAQSMPNPEPATMLLFGGAVAIGAARRLRRRFSSL